MPSLNFSGAEIIFIGLGSNLGRSRQILLQALESLQKITGYREISRSSCYLSAPVDVLDQPDFYNCVVQAEYLGKAQILLRELQNLEKKHLRERLKAKGPRTLDMDLLIYGRHIIKKANLTVPHPRMIHRAFVLRPLMEIAEDLLIPLWNKKPGDFLKTINQKIEIAEWL